MFTHLSSLVGGAMRRLGIEKQLEAQAILQTVNEYLATELGLEAVQAFRYSQGKVSIGVEHPAAAAFITQQQQPLLTKLRQLYPGRRFIGFRITVRR